MATIDGVQYGTSCKRTRPLPNAVYGKLVSWTRSWRAGYTAEQITPDKAHIIGTEAHAGDKSFFMLYKYDGAIEDAAPDPIIGDIGPVDTDWPSNISPVDMSPWSISKINWPEDSPPSQNRSRSAANPPTHQPSTHQPDAPPWPNY